MTCSGRGPQATACLRLAWEATQHPISTVCCATSKDGKEGAWLPCSHPRPHPPVGDAPPCMSADLQPFFAAVAADFIQPLRPNPFPVKCIGHSSASIAQAELQGGSTRLGRQAVSHASEAWSRRCCRALAITLASTAHPHPTAHTACPHLLAHNSCRGVIEAVIADCAPLAVMVDLQPPRFGDGFVGTGEP